MELEFGSLSISGQLNKYNHSEERKNFCINAEGLVRSPWMQREIALIGFLPYSISSTLTPLNRPFICTPYLLKYDVSDKIFLIYKTAKCAKGNSYPLKAGTEFVSILDTFESSVQNLEAQLKQWEKQYEYYRNKLLTFE